MGVTQTSGFERVVAALGGTAALEGVDSGSLAGALSRLEARGRLEHANLAIPEEAWPAQIASALGDSEPAEWVARIDALRGADLLLAATLTTGDTTANAVFERTLIPEIDRVLRRFRIAKDHFPEYRQRVRVRLLVAEPERAPRIAQYRGRGSLAGWVRTTTARLVLTSRRDQPSDQPLEGVAAQLVGASVRLPGFAAKQRSVFLSVLREAFAGLEQRERTLLRLRFIDNVAAVALARSYNVHESTMSRWLGAAKERLAGRFERLAALEVDDTEGVRDLLEVMQSSLGTSLQAVFVSDSRG